MSLRSGWLADKMFRSKAAVERNTGTDWLTACFTHSIHREWCRHQASISHSYHTSDKECIKGRVCSFTACFSYGSFSESFSRSSSGSFSGYSYLVCLFPLEEQQTQDGRLLCLDLDPDPFWRSETVTQKKCEIESVLCNDSVASYHETMCSSSQITERV